MILKGTEWWLQRNFKAKINSNPDRAYNIEYEEDFMQGIQDTISLHRKKHTNTLYTINALNDLIRELNGGKLDKSFSVDWENYRNSLLLTSDSGLNKIPTKIHMIINVETWESDRK